MYPPPLKPCVSAPHLIWDLTPLLFTREQFFPKARPAIAATALGMNRLDVHQQRIVAQVPWLHVAGPPNEVPVVPGHADLEHPALHRDRPDAPVTFDEGSPPPQVNQNRRPTARSDLSPS